MVAFKELQKQYTTPAHRRRHGLLDNVPIGLRLNGRGEAAILGIHRKILSGIDCIKDEACYAVCSSGGYKDDQDHDDDHNDSSNIGTVIYTGSGGQKGKRQVKDQEENNDNKSMIRSCASGIPIRMLRRLQGVKQGSSTLSTTFPVYEYVGLYKCTDYTYEPSADGPLVFKFTLQPIQGSWKRPSSSLMIPIAHRARGSRTTNGGAARDRLMGCMEQNATTTTTSRNQPTRSSSGGGAASSRRQRMGASSAASQQQHHHQQVVVSLVVKDIHIALSKYLPADSSLLMLTTPESVEHCQDLLEQLEKCDMTLEILTESLIGKVITKFKHHPQVGPTAKALVKKWKAMIPGATAATASTSTTTSRQQAKSTESASASVATKNNHTTEIPQQQKHNASSTTFRRHTSDGASTSTSTRRPTEPMPMPIPAAAATKKLATDMPRPKDTTNNHPMVQAKPPRPPKGGKRRGLSIAQLCSSIEGRANDRR
jgi:hypothetical protein